MPMTNTNYLEYTEHEYEAGMSIKEQLKLIAQNDDGASGGFILWRRQGGATGSFPLALFHDEESAMEAKELVEAVTEDKDSTGWYTVEEL
jgi:hypothetical protein